MCAASCAKTARRWGASSRPHQLRLDDHDRALRADRHRVRRGELRQVEVGHLGHVERRVGDRVLAPDVAELLLAETHRGAEIALAQRALVAQLDQLADDRVEIRDRAERGGRGAVGGVLEGARGDARQAVALGRARCDAGGLTQRSVAPHWRCGSTRRMRRVAGSCIGPATRVRAAAHAPARQGRMRPCTTRCMHRVEQQPSDSGASPPGRRGARRR